jgi:hypothetical protein
VTCLRNQLCRYLMGALTLQEFREWFSPQAWNVDQRESRDTARLVHEIDLVLAEYDHGHWTEDELKQHFVPVLATLVYWLDRPLVYKSDTAAVGNQCVLFPLRYPGGH